MSKGIVIQKRRRYTIVMDRAGQFHKAEPLKDVDIGVETSFTPKHISQVQTFFLPRTMAKQKVLAMVLGIAIFSFPLYALYDLNNVYAYVNIDINPSMQMELNEQMLVEKINPLNKDAETLLTKLEKLKGKSVDSAADEIISLSQQLGLTDRNKAVIIGVSYKKKPKENSQVTERIDSYFIDHPKNGVKIATFEVPDEVREQAKDQNISMNELMAITLINSSSVLTNDDRMSKLNKEEKKLIQTYYSNVDEARPEFIEEQEEKNQKEEKYEEKEEEWKNQTDETSEVSEKNDLPPGLDKKDVLPPGLEKKETLPPGLEKNVGNGQVDVPPPGLQQKQDRLPPGLQKKQDNQPPGLQKKQDSLPPGLKKKQDNLPPGLQKKQGNLPPGLQKKQDNLPPGIEKKLKNVVED